MSALTILIAWMIEVAMGWPDTLYRRIRHPVVWMGALISWLDTRLNDDSRANWLRALTGAFTTLLVISVSWMLVAFLLGLLPAGPARVIIAAVIAASLLASRSLYQHVVAVAQALSTLSLSDAREAVAHIVGRDPSQLDDAGVARAAIESLAENTSDGVIAPVFWGVVLGVPGLAAYKAINTLDSMIGHRNARYEYFGKFAARLDDAANWIPARLTGALFALAGRARAWSTMWRDAGQHRSPNAGWPEAAMAGALGVRLSGPRHYGAHVNDEPWLNADAEDPDAQGIDRALMLYVRAMLIAAAVLAVIAALSVTR